MRAIKNVTSSWNWPNLSASNCCTCPPTRPTSISSNACGNSSRRIVCTRPITTTLRSSNRPSHPVSLKLKPHTGPPSTPCFPTASRPSKNQKLCHGRVYFAVRCPCGHRSIARPGVGSRSDIEGRRRNLQMSECCLVGPMLATFIAALSLRFRLSRRKIQEFLGDWLSLELGVATIERCIHEFGLASEPVVEQLIQEVRAADIVHLDETPWYQRGVLRWMWVATTAMTTIFRIASRRKEELTALIGDAFLGWLVTDGYVAYRDHPRRQRCLAHLIRKGLALAQGWYGAGSGFGRELVRDLRRLIERVHDGEGGETSAVKRLMARIEWNCQCNRHEVEKKVRDLAGEILNDWEAVVAFVAAPNLPPTNNEAERALRHAVIARRISFGTRTDEGSRFYAAGLSVIATCRQRGVETWAYAGRLIAAARANLPAPQLATRAVA